ncbi:MAG TPA: LptF/LptG family permease [Gemmatimonadaceae bacterium]|nr:LptF/LptG family permease [Gemmatimonadaceae bacterium]
MKILHRYVLKEHIGPLVFALTALTSLLLLQYIAKRFGDLVGKGLPWNIIAEFLGLSIPLTVALSMPMAVLVSTLYAFSRLAAENEITAMKAGGVSMRSVLTPVLWAALVLTIGMVVFNDQVLPRANHKLRTLQGDIAQKKPSFGLREQVINEVSPGKLYLRAGRLAKSSNLMRDVTIYDVGDATRRRTIYADSGNMVMLANRSDLQLTLYSGTVNDVPVATPEKLERVYFDAELVRVKGVGNEFKQTTSDTFKGEREMSVCEMEKQAAISRRELASARKEFKVAVAQANKRKLKLLPDVYKTKTNDPITIGLGKAYCALIGEIGVKKLGAQLLAPPRPKPVRPLRPGESRTDTSIAHGKWAAVPAPSIVTDAQLPSEIDGLKIRVDDARRTSNGYEVEIQKKFALAAACFVFILLGAPIALRFPRGGVGLTIGVSLIVFALYYVGLIAGESLARRGIVPPFLSMWGANLIFTLLALFLLSRMGRENTSGRGGDMRELLKSIRWRLRQSRASSSTPAPRPSAS